MKRFSPFTCCVNAAFLALVVLYQLSIAGCTLRCLDSLFLSGPEGIIIVDEETACLDDQGASQGFLLTPVHTLVVAPIEICLLRSDSSIHLPMPYLEPLLEPPEHPGV